MVQKVAARASEQVTLNVGGAKFTTTVFTLRHAPPNSLFNAMFSGRHVIAPDEVALACFLKPPESHRATELQASCSAACPCTHSWQEGWSPRQACMQLMRSFHGRRAQSGCFFLDRDGRHFHDVLNFLRVGGSMGAPPPPARALA